MGKLFAFSAKEKNKINLAHFLENLFIEYNNLYMINIFLSDSAIITKGKKTDSKKIIQLSVIFKYPTHYCVWFDGETRIYNKKEDINRLPINDIINSLVTYSHSVNFYLKNIDKKITLSDLGNLILNREELSEEIFSEERICSFSREVLSEDLRRFLGKEILSKQEASRLAQKLNSNFIKEKFVKV